MKTFKVLILGFLVMGAIICRGQIVEPGWFQAPDPNPVFEQDGNSIVFHGLAGGQSSSPAEPASPVAEVITPQIQALADGLQHDPQRIFDYVHDHIQFVLYFGAKKGAQLTLLEKSGNDFDQCALLVALLRAAGYTGVQYQFGWQRMPYDDTNNSNRDLHHWWQLTLNNTNWTTTYTYLGYLATIRGYPKFYITADGNFEIQRVWVALTIGSTTYQLDPAFKVSQQVSGISLPEAMSSTSLSNGLMSAAGGTVTANYVQSLSESSVRNKLAGYTTNLINYLQSNAPNASVQQVLGGWQIIPANNTSDFNSLPTFPVVNPSGNMPVVSWTYQPTNLMSTFNVAFARTNIQWFMPQLQGQRLSLTFSNNGLAQLWLEDSNVLSGNVGTSRGTTNVTLTITHPLGAWDTANNVFLYNPTNLLNQTTTVPYQTTNATYALLYAFEPDWGWLQQRQGKLDGYLQQGLNSTSRQVVSETLNIMGLSWLLQSAQVEQILAPQLGVLPMNFHRFGRMGQESGKGYYVDVYMQMSGEYPSGGNDAAHKSKDTDFDLTSFFGSALEHGVIEQLQSSNLVAASTIKMLQIANTNGQAVYLASSANWSTVQSALTGYDTATKTFINTNYINRGYSVLLPQNGSNHLSGQTGSWAGYGYEARLVVNGAGVDSVMGISGGYHGGYSEFQQSVADINATWQTVDNQPNAYNAATPMTPAATGADPVDMANGTFQVEHADLTLGQAEPRGIHFSRYYNGARRNSNPAGMAGGWLHNYCVSAANVSAPQASLGETTPQQMAPMLAATCAAASLYNTSPNAKNWMVTALVAKWGIDQLYKNGVSVMFGKDAVQFIKQPDGTFTPPGNCTMTLTQTGLAYSVSQRHGNTFKFDSLGRLTNIVDQYAQSLNVSYLNSTSSLPYQVTDWKNRRLTFSYTSGQLTSVTDNSSPARSVNYGYSTAYNPAGDLTAFTDAEGKTSTYQYDNNHQITATLDAQARLVVSNVYDSLGHVATQYTQGDTNKTWRIFWSGWQTVVQDPAGGAQTYFYDDQTRIVGQQDALGNLSQTAYDGQNHVVTTVSPLNELNQFVYDGSNNLVQAIDALNHTNQFFYDSQNRLYRSLDPLGNPTTYGYNAQFSLTGQTNGAGDWVNYAFNADGTLNTKTDAGGTNTYGYDSTYRQLNSLIYPGNLGVEYFTNNALGDVIGHQDARGFGTAFQYNARRELTNTIAPTNITVSVGFDPVGNVATMTDARNNVSASTWSATRHLLSTTLPATPQGTPTITNGYDSRDMLVISSDALKNQVLYTNDLAGRLVSATDPLKRTARFTFDADGHKLTCANAGNETNSQAVDANGQLIKLTDGANHVSSRGYDAAGNQIILTNRNGKIWHFYFDAANRLTNTVTPLGRSARVTLDHRGLPTLAKDMAGQFTTNGFDAKGRLTNRVDALASTRFDYDANNNLTNLIEGTKTNAWVFDAYNRVQTYKDTAGNLIQYKYDVAGNLTNLVYPGNKNVYYAYDALNRMTNVVDWANRTSSFSYDLNSHITKIVRPNGSYRTIGYDAAGQATNIMEQMGNSLPIAIFNHGWSSNACMAWEFAAPLPHVSTVATRQMRYDDDNRLTLFKGPSMGDFQSVGMDDNGNLTSAPLTNDTFVSYAFDARNRLLNASGVTNFYDAANNRMGQNQGTNRTIFVVNPNTKLPQVLMRIKNGVTNYYIYGAGLLYQITETATATNTLTYHYDFRGSTIALSKDSGLVTDRIEYSLYGLTTYRTGTNDTPFLFNGRYGVMTDANGLLYMRARYYNPYLCRFISQDPSGFGGGLNWFAYANGNPVSYLDPFGLNAHSTGDTATTWLSGSDLTSYLLWQQIGSEAAAQNEDTFGNALDFLANAYGSYQQQQASRPQWVQQLDQLAQLAVMAIAPEAGALRLTGVAQETLAGTQNGVLLGTIERGQINLFEATAGGVETHAQLLSQGLAGQGAQGFSIIIQEGQVVLFRPVSQLNSATLNFNLPQSVIPQVFRQVGGTSATRIIGN